MLSLEELNQPIAANTSINECGKDISSTHSYRYFQSKLVRQNYYICSPKTTIAAVIRCFRNERPASVGRSHYMAMRSITWGRIAGTMNSNPVSFSYLGSPVRLKRHSHETQLITGGSPQQLPHNPRFAQCIAGFSFDDEVMMRFSECLRTLAHRSWKIISKNDIRIFHK